MSDRVGQVRDELAGLLREHYPPSVLAEIADGDAEVVARRALRGSSIRRMLDAVPEARGALIAVARCQGGVSGEQVRRSAIVDGLGDVEPGLRSMVSRGLLVLRPAPGQRDWSLEEEVASRRYLRRELLIPADLGGFLESFVDDPEAEASPVVEDRDVARLPVLSLDGLEVNLLHLSTALSRRSLVLNKDYTPNRRSLRAFVRGLRLPGNHRGDADPNRPEVFEPVYFLLGMALALGLVVLDGRRIHADRQQREAFFSASEAERNKAILRAYRFCDQWNEAESARVLRATPTMRGLEVGRRGVLASDPTLGKLGGARGQVLGELPALSLTDWTEVEQITETLLALDRGYLERTLELGPGAPGVTPTQFIYAVLTVALPWLGVGESGTWVDPEGRATEVFRLTPRGARALTGKVLPSEPPAGRALLVQPNLEVTVFLDAADLALLLELYRVAERVSLSDRVAVFRLTAETVQRGLGDGAEPEGVIKFLEHNARAPVPESVKFSIRDWERIQRKIVLYSEGALMLYPDADALDTAVDTLAHYWQGEPIFMPSSEAVFLPGGAASDFGCLAGMERAHVIDYAGPPLPCLSHHAGLELRELPTGLDMVTSRQMSELASFEEREEGRAWRLDPERIIARWGTDSSQELVDFLGPRLLDGLSPRLEILLLASLQKEVRAEVHSDVVVVTTSDDMVCDALLEVREIEAIVLTRLGPTALLVPAASADQVARVLAELGLAQGA